MLAKLLFPEYFDVDMLRYKEVYSFATEIIPQRPKRNLPTLPEEKECSNTEFKRSIKMRRRKNRRQRLPSLPEHEGF